MPYGSGPLLRTALASARPWQRYLVAVAMVGGGATLVAVGHVGGAVLAVAGLLLLGRMLRYRWGRRRARAVRSGDGPAPT